MNTEKHHEFERHVQSDPERGDRGAEDRYGGAGGDDGRSTSDAGRDAGWPGATSAAAAAGTWSTFIVGGVALSVGMFLALALVGAARK
jgi:hypothetical protein